MRDFKGMKRQRGRNRNNGKPQQHNANRAFDSNGPEGIKVRGAAQSVFEKYQQLARDAATAGDRVLAENYLQHAEHYFRLIRAVQPNRPVTDIIGRDQFTSGIDIDFEAEPPEEPETPPEPEAAATAEGEGEERPRFENRDRENRRDRDRDRFRDRDRDDRQRDERDRDRPRDDRDRDRNRDDRNRDDRNREDRQRDDRQRDDRPRDDRQRDDRPREDREGGGRRDRWRDRDDRRERFDRDRERDRPERAEARDPLAVIEPQAAPLAPEPAAEPSPRLRGQDGAVSELPGFLTRASEPAPEAEPARKPRRTRKTADKAVSDQTEEA